MERKNKFSFAIFGALLALLLTAGVGWNSCSRREKPPATPKTSYAASMALPHPRGETAGGSVKPVAVVTGVEAGCTRLWDDLAAIAIDEIEQSPDILLSLPRAGECSRVPARLRFWHERFREACGKLTRDNWQDGQLAQDCFVSLATYRAYVSDWRTRDKSLSEIDDAGVLADKLMVAYLSPSSIVDAKGMTPLAAIASRLLERDPHSVSAAKAFLSALGDEGRTRWSERTWRRAERALEVATEGEGDAAGVRAVARWVRSRGREGADIPGTVLQRLGGFSFLDFYVE